MVYLLCQLLSLSYVKIWNIQIEGRPPVNTRIKLDRLRVVLIGNNNLPLQFVGVVNVLAKNPRTKEAVKNYRFLENESAFFSRNDPGPFSPGPATLCSSYCLPLPSSCHPFILHIIIIIIVLVIIVIIIIMIIYILKMIF